MKTTDFSNPMYDAFGGSVANTETGGNNVAFNNSKKKNNLDNNGTTNYLHDAEMFASTIDVDNPQSPPSTQTPHPLDESYTNRFGSAILSPSSVIHKSASPQIPIRQTALKPTTIDTDKDTAHLVEEDRTD